MKVQLVEVKPDKQSNDALHTVLRPANPDNTITKTIHSEQPTCRKILKELNSDFKYDLEKKNISDLA